MGRRPPPSLGEAWGLLQAQCGCAARGGRATCHPAGGQPCLAGLPRLPRPAGPGGWGANASTVIKHDSEFPLAPARCGEPEGACAQRASGRDVLKSEALRPGFPLPAHSGTEGQPLRGVPGAT